MGPEVAVAHTEKSLQSTLESYLEEIQINSNELVYYSEDEFFSFKDTRQELETYDNICSFYRGLEPSETYNKLALIPFHVIMSLSPDLLLKQTFENLGLDFNFDYYHKKENPLNVENPSKDKPLLYNLLGCIEDDDSLVYTYDHLFDYLTRILGTHELPRNLRDKIANSKNFIFLGFKYERWYLKLLFRLLGLNKRKQIDSAKTSHQISSKALSYYTHEFNVNFVDDNVVDFVNTLYTKCKENKLLRAAGAGRKFSAKDEIKTLISQNRLKEVFQKITVYTRKNAAEYLNDVILLYNQFNQVQGQIDLDLIDDKDARQALNKITKSLLELIDKIFR